VTRAQAGAGRCEAEVSSGEADGCEAEMSARGAHADTGNQSTEQLQLSHADVKNDVAVSETSRAQKISPSVDLTANCSTASPPAKRLKVLMLRGLLWVTNF